MEVVVVVVVQGRGVGGGGGRRSLLCCHHAKRKPSLLVVIGIQNERSKLIFMGNMERRHMTLVVPLDFCLGYFYGFHPHTLLSYSYNGFLSSCCLFPRGIFMGIFDEFINWPCQEILVGEC